MKYGMYTIDDFNVKGKTILCRIDINQPIDQKTGRLKDTTRIMGCIPTIRELSEKGAKVVLLAHQGGDLEYKNYYTTRPHAEVISNTLGKTIYFIDDVTGLAARDKIRNLREGEILLLDNVRFMAEEMTLFETKMNLSHEQQSLTQVVKKLAPLGDLFICDAFSAAHRSQPTLVGFEQVLPSAMGRLFEEEFDVITSIMEDPKRPCIFVLGGAKIQDAFMMMNTLLEKGTTDFVLTGGLVANIMLVANGIDIGRPSMDFIENNNLSEFIHVAENIIRSYSDKVLIPSDLAYTDNGRHEIGSGYLPVDRLLTDIGHDTVGLYVNYIEKAGTIFVNGPMGVFENEVSEYGTRSIWNAVADSCAYSVLGGGDSIAAINKYKLEKKISYICTGGGALVRFLSGEELPVVKALRYAAQKFGPVISER
ncbi:MAG: phosphoglycerate kinase [Clostridiales bacterium]|nr:phosphoglycerate kinase [Clostridiales bacterium]